MFKFLVSLLKVVAILVAFYVICMLFEVAFLFIDRALDYCEGAAVYVYCPRS